jgi:hypothetical protein
MTDNNPAAGSATGPDPSLPRPRRHLRLAAIGGIAAVAILGGGITAVAAAAAPEPTTSTSTVPIPSSATSAPPTGSASAKPSVPRTRTPHLDGTVTSVSSSTVLIKDRDGFTRTVLVTSKTTYADGLKAALPVGTEIHAEGTVDANGTSLDATAIGKRPTAPAGGPGWGGPGRGGHGGPPGSGAWGPGGPGQSSGAKPAPTTGASAPSTSTAAPTTS